MIYEEKKLDIMAIFFSIIFIIVSFMLITLYFGQGKNHINYNLSEYVLYEENKEVADEISYIDDIYMINKDDIRIQKWQKIEEFKNKVMLNEIRTLRDDEMEVLIKNFKDTVIIGDSLAEQLKNYFDDYYVKSRIGANFDSLSEMVDEAIQEYPKHVIIFKGLNDVVFFPSAASYTRAFTEFITKIQNALPNANIYVCSVLPPSEELAKEKPQLLYWDEYNKLCKELCDALQVNFVDIGFMLTSDDMRYKDGMHFKSKYYNFWIQYMNIWINY